MAERSLRLQESCTSIKGEKYYFKSSQVVQRYYVDRNANLSYCKVPKAGSSLWTRIFMTLQGYQQNRIEEWEHTTRVYKIFQKSRNTLHSYKPFFSPRLPEETSVKVIVSRNPYSRLFSAFIDKIYLLDKDRISHTIAQENGKTNFSCGHNVTFQEFLDYVVSRAADGKEINRHWAPVYLLCHPCDVRYDVIGKVETLTEDIKYTLNQARVSKTARNKLLTILQNKTSTFGVLSTYMSKWNNKRKICPKLKEYLLKIWTALKYQGDIKHDIPFPTNAFSPLLTKNPDTPNIIDVFVQFVKRYKPTSEERKLQRRRALVEAYRSIKRSTIRRIQELYKLDFLLFRYKVSPPV